MTTLIKCCVDWVLAGMVVFFLIKEVMTPQAVSISRDRGATFRSSRLETISTIFLSMTVGSRSTKTALGTCLKASVSVKTVLKESSPPPKVLSEGIWPSGWMLARGSRAPSRHCPSGSRSIRMPANTWRGGQESGGGEWRMGDVGCRMEDGVWKDCGWRVEDGGWRIEDGGWRS